MRHGQSRLGQHEVVIQQEIEIEGPRFFLRWSGSPKCPLDLATRPPVGSFGCNIGFDLCDAVQEPFRPRCCTIVDRLGPVQR